MQRPVVCLAMAAALWCGPACAIPGAPAPGMEIKAQQRINLEYMEVFRKTWLASRNSAPAANAPPYDQQALTKATADRDAAAAACKSRMPALKTETAYAGCLTAAYRVFAAAINLKDQGVTEALAASLAAAAADADAGRLTPGQAHDVNDTLAGFYESLFAQLSTIQETRRQADLATRYGERFEKAYLAAGPAAGAAAPPLDDDALAPAREAAGKARDACAAQPGIARKAYADCVFAAEKQFAQAIRLRDGALTRAFEATLRSAAADPEVEAFSLDQFIVITSALVEIYSDRINRQQIVYHAVADRAVAEGYAVRFLANYVATVGRMSDLEEAPYDGDAWDEAGRTLSAVLGQCVSQQDDSARQVASLECWLAGYRGFADAIKVRDRRLLESFLSAMRQAAADTDAGRLTHWQQRAVYDAILGAYYSANMRGYDGYLVHKYQPMVTSYVIRFDNAVIAAGEEGGGDDAAPWDRDDGAIAQKPYEQASNLCFDKKSLFKTHAAFWDCRLAADHALALAVHTRNLALMERWSAAIHEAATDADAGKLSADQLTAVCAGLGFAYEAVRAEAWRVWRIKQAQGASR